MTPEQYVTVRQVIDDPASDCRVDSAARSIAWELWVWEFDPVGGAWSTTDGRAFVFQWMDTKETCLEPRLYHGHDGHKSSYYVRLFVLHQPTRVRVEFTTLDQCLAYLRQFVRWA